jgi:hypothetical protein
MKLNYVDVKTNADVADNITFRLQSGLLNSGNPEM